jgi:hypothetical protein
MKLLDAIREYRRKGVDKGIVHPSGEAELNEMLRQQRLADHRSITAQVYDAPAEYNRATRRAVGMLSKVWRWASPAEMGNAEQAPRYIRRHHIARIPKTRRQRRHRARVLRIIEAKGIR